MACGFVKVSEEEIVANEAAFFCPFLSLGIYPPLFTSPSGDSCIIYIYIYIYVYRLFS